MTTPGQCALTCTLGDKGQPCSNCRRTGVKCVALQRQRLPRGRNGGRKKADVELKARVNRLESLVKTLEAGNGSGLDASSPQQDSREVRLLPQAS